MTKGVAFLFLTLLGISVARAGKESPVFLAGSISGFIMPGFDGDIVHVNNGFTLGFGGDLGVRTISTLYITTSVTYLPRSGSVFTLTSLGRAHEVKKTFAEMRLDFGTLWRPQLNPSFRFNAELGASYLTEGDAPGMNDVTPVWGAYAGIGLEHSPASEVSLFLALKYRYLQKHSANFGGAQIQVGVRLLATSRD